MSSAILLLVFAEACLLIVFLIHLSRRQTKATILQGLRTNIDLAKFQFEYLTMDLVPLQTNSARTDAENKTLEMKRLLHESALQQLLKAYNEGCQKFLKKQLVPRDFVALYHVDIRRYIEAYPKNFREPLTCFNQMVCYYRRFHKNFGESAP